MSRSLVLLSAAACLLLMVCAVSASSITRVELIDSDSDHSVFESDLTTFVELAAQLDAELELQREVYPVLDNTGGDEYRPVANLTRFKVKPVIDTTVAFEHDAPLRPKEAAPPVVAPTAAGGVATNNGTKTPTPIIVKGVLSNIGKAIANSDWYQWLKKWGKSFNVIESAKRLAIFLANKVRVAALNVLTAGRYTIDGPFSDLTPAEFKAKYLRARPKVASRARAFIEGANYVQHEGDVFFELTAEQAATAAPIDYRRQMTAVKKQGECGACYAFAAAAIVESAWHRKGNPLTSLSVQQVMDCNLEEQYGCGGGNFASSLVWYMTHGSIAEKSYKYTQAQGTCKAANGPGPKVKTTGLAIPQCMGGACAGQKESGLIVALNKYGPLAAIIDSKEMQFYESGIITPSSDCKHHWDELNHAVNIVGYNPTQKYWIIRNSWGSSWGESGYARLSYGQNTCGIANFVSYATV